MSWSAFHCITLHRHVVCRCEKARGSLEGGLLQRGKSILVSGSWKGKVYGCVPCCPCPGPALNSGQLGRLAVCFTPMSPHLWSCDRAPHPCDSGCLQAPGHGIFFSFLLPPSLGQFKPKPLQEAFPENPYFLHCTFSGPSDCQFTISLYSPWFSHHSGAASVSGTP